ncbi:hypothetical protein GGR56DRAFT_665861 [Xylariaceae sp. FL0804]|nr:hypothetical protein GGR56DRAFT_665861 [Xylariaceae sp. FL0804]
MRHVSSQFITSINTVARDDETRRRVRSHARRQKLPSTSSTNSGGAMALSSRLPPPLRRGPGTQLERTSKFRLKAAAAAPQPPASNNHRQGLLGRTTAAIVGARRARAGVDEPREREQQQQPQQLAQPPRGEGDFGGAGGGVGGPLGRPSSSPPSFETAMVTRELGLTSMARELPNFPTLRIEATPLTEELIKYCLTVCLSPREPVVQKWFERAGAPTYLNTYYTGFLANAFAMNPQGEWFDSIQVDAAASHAFLAMIAAMHNSLAEWDDTSTFEFHRMHAIKSINQRLDLEGKDYSTPVSEGVVMAVALLVNNETFLGSISAAAAHLDGLKRMVELRGGIVEGFKHSTIIQRALAWADFSYATLTSQPLIFPFVPQLASSLSLRDNFTSRSSMGGSDDPASLGALAIRNRETVELFELMYAITDCLNSFDYQNIATMSEERVQVGDSIYLLEWRLCQLEDSQRKLRSAQKSADAYATPPYGADGRQPGAALVDFSETVTYASHLFLHLALRGQPPAAPRHRGLTEALMSSLGDTLLALDVFSGPETSGSPNSLYSPSLGSSSSATAENSEGSNADVAAHDLHVNILLWCLFVGCCVRVPVARREWSYMYQAMLLGDHRRFFVTALINYCRIRHVTSKEALASRLKDVMWLDSWCEHQLDLIWREVGELLTT